MSMRFYQPSESKFIDDFIYQPPWELMNTALATQQKGYDEAMGQASLFDNIDIKYIDTDADRQNVQNIQNSYGDRAQSIVDAIRSNPNEWRKYSKDIRNLQRDLQKDYTSGDISKIQNNYNRYQTYLKISEEARKNDPHRFNASMAEAFTRYGGNSLNGDVWSQEDILPDPEFNKLLEQNYKDLKANLSSRSTQTASGGYLIDNEYEVEDLSEERLMAYTANKLLADPKIGAWARQSQKWGLGKYYGDDGNMIPLFNSQEVTNAQGEVIGTRVVPNQESGFYNLLNAASLQAYTKEKQKQGLRADQVALQASSQAFQLSKMREEYALKDKLADRNYMLNVKKEAAKGQAWAQEEIARLNGLSFTATIGTPQITNEDNMRNIQSAIASGAEPNPLDLEYNRISTDFALQNLNLTTPENRQDIKEVDKLIQKGMKPEDAVIEYFKEKFKGSIFQSNNYTKDSNNVEYEYDPEGVLIAKPSIKQKGQTLLSVGDALEGRIKNGYYKGQKDIENFIEKEYKPLLENIKRVDKKKEEWFKNSLSTKTTDEQFITPSSLHSNQVKNQVMTNPSAFDFLQTFEDKKWFSKNESGWKKTKMGDLSNGIQDVNIIGKTANGAHNNYGYLAEVTDNNGNTTTGYIYLKEGMKGSNIDANLKAGFLFDTEDRNKYSETGVGQEQAKILNTYLASDISTMLSNTPRNPSTGTTLIQYPIGDSRIPIRLENNGNITILSEEFPDKSITFEGILQAAKYLQQ